METDGEFNNIEIGILYSLYKLKHDKSNLHEHEKACINDFLNSISRRVRLKVRHLTASYKQEETYIIELEERIGKKYDDESMKRVEEVIHSYFDFQTYSDDALEFCKEIINGDYTILKLKYEDIKSLMFAYKKMYESYVVFKKFAREENNINPDLKPFDYFKKYEEAIKKKHKKQSEADIVLNALDDQL